MAVCDSLRQFGSSTFTFVNYVALLTFVFLVVRFSLYVHAGTIYAPTGMSSISWARP